MRPSGWASANARSPAGWPQNRPMPHAAACSPQSAALTPRGAKASRACGPRARTIDAPSARGEGDPATAICAAAAAATPRATDTAEAGGARMPDILHGGNEVLLRGPTLPAALAAIEAHPD